MASALQLLLSGRGDRGGTHLKPEDGLRPYRRIEGFPAWEKVPEMVVEGAACPCSVRLSAPSPPARSPPGCRGGGCSPFAVPVIVAILALTVARRLLPSGFLRRPSRALGLTGILLASAGTGVVTFLLSLYLYLQQQHHWTPLATAGAFIPFAVVLIATSRVAGVLVGRFGAAPVTTAGLLTGAAGLALLAGIDPGTTFALGLLPGLVLLPAGASLIFSGAAVLSAADVPAHQTGLAGGTMNTAMELGPTVGLAALMSVAATQTDTVTGYAWAFSTAAAVYLAAALAALALNRRTTTARRDPS
ncbi:MFS transporter [Streptomyces sp. BE308]|uniref:MFS transporter n=1 Tax=Streptomyces sp. BE308 TaxID=3002529 RepID=UPI002E79274A|nr:MFS transporter [Streptomyces sp. BE308]MEE1795931.1 MFS transporter [Streptomyces sp. BE308]